MIDSSLGPGGAGGIPGGGAAAGTGWVPGTIPGYGCKHLIFEDSMSIQAKIYIYPCKQFQLVII